MDKINKDAALKSVRVDKNIKNSKTQKTVKEATVVEETKLSEKEEVKEEQILDKESKKEEGAGKIKFTRNVTLDDKGDEDKTAKVNFVDKDFMKDFVKQKTERSEEAPGLDKEKQEKEVQGNKGQEVNVDDRKIDSFTEQDFMEFAEVFMEILDMGIAQALKFFAKDTTAEPYELDEKKRKRLSRQLGNLFLKYNKKFSLEFMFFVTLCICYSGPFMEAKNRRKLTIENGGTPPERTQGKPKKYSR